ncbi:MAG: hypothetical protein ACOYNS_02030 [Bacteroidota bacterium]
MERFTEDIRRTTSSFTFQVAEPSGMPMGMWKYREIFHEKQYFDEVQINIFWMNQDMIVFFRHGIFFIVKKMIAIGRLFR